MNNKFKMLLLFLIYSSLMYGCARNSETTINNDELVTQKIESYCDDLIVERGTVDVIRRQLDNDLKKNYNNIIIKNARVGDGTIMPSYDVKITGKDDIDICSIVDYVYGDKFDSANEKYYGVNYKGEPRNTDYPATFEPADYAGDGIRPPNSYNFDIKEFKPNDENFTQSLYTYSIGNVWGSEVGILDNDYYMYEEYSIYERYDLSYNSPNEKLAYKMADGNEWDISEAVSFVEKFWNNCLSISDPVKYIYKVKTLFVIKLDTDKFGYLFEIERKDENGNYFDVDCGYIQNNEAIESGNSFKIDNTQMTWITEKEVITRFIKDYSIEPTKQTSDGDNLLTLGGAANILSEALAPNIDLNINSAELNYVVICKKYPYFETWEYPWYYEYTCLANCDFEIKPYWCFRTNRSTLMNFGDCEIYFVDAFTGELSIMTY